MTHLVFCFNAQKWNSVKPLHYFATHLEMHYNSIVCFYYVFNIYCTFIVEKKRYTIRILTGSGKKQCRKGSFP
jgi:hypothetical protein